MSRPNDIKFTNQNQMQKPAIRTGHVEHLKWMGTDEFRAIMQMYDDVFGVGRCCFRPTNGCVVVISLDPDCTGFIGLRSSREMNEHQLQIGNQVMDRDYYTDLKERFGKFKKTVNRRSEEEVLVIRTLHHALTHKLVIDESQPELVFINHEWRFPDRKKSDLLAVNMDTGRLTIIEFKDSDSKRHEAFQQLRHYKEMIEQDITSYSKFFSLQLRVMGELYNNTKASQSSITSNSIDLVFACPAFSGGVKYNYI